MSNDIFGSLIAFLNNLDEANISYTIEKFISAGEIYGAEAFNELFAKYSDLGQEDGEPEVLQSVELLAMAG